MSRGTVIGLVLAGALLVQYLTAISVPYGIMNYLWRESVQQYGSNQMTHRDLPGADSREVVRPSPDLLYSICPYNLNQGPIAFSGTVPSNYWSLQFYQMNNVNYYGRTNQREQSWRNGESYRFLLLGPGQDPSRFDGELIQAPANRGVALVRISAIGDLEELREVQRLGECRPL